MAAWRTAVREKAGAKIDTSRQDFEMGVRESRATRRRSVGGGSRGFPTRGALVRQSPVGQGGQGKAAARGRELLVDDTGVRDGVAGLHLDLDAPVGAGHDLALDRNQLDLIVGVLLGQLQGRAAETGDVRTRGAESRGGEEEKKEKERGTMPVPTAFPPARPSPARGHVWSAGGPAAADVSPAPRGRLADARSAARRRLPDRADARSAARGSARFARCAPASSPARRPARHRYH